MCSSAITNRKNIKVIMTGSEDKHTAQLLEISLRIEAIRMRMKESGEYYPNARIPFSRLHAQSSLNLNRKQWRAAENYI
jgi:hypothetical protein